MAVRPALATDIPLLLPLVQGYYHDSPVPLTIDSQAMALHLDRQRSDTSLGHLLVATVDQELAGFAILYRSFLSMTSTWHQSFVGTGWRVNS